MNERSVYRGRTSDGYSFEVDYASGRVTHVRTLARRRYDAENLMPDHSLRPVLLDWFVDKAQGSPTNSLNWMLVSCNHFVRFLSEECRVGISAEVYSAFLDWSKLQPGRRSATLDEKSRRTTAFFIRDFLEWASEETDLITPVDAEDAGMRYTSFFRGFSERERRRRQEQAGLISSDDLRRLYRAIVREVEEAESVLESGSDACELYDPVLPLLPFPLLLAVLEAMRSGELNGIKIGHVDTAWERVFVHQENKQPAQLLMSPEVKRAWSLADADALREQLRARESDLTGLRGLLMAFVTHFAKSNATRGQDIERRLIGLLREHIPSQEIPDLANSDSETMDAINKLLDDVQRGH